VIAGLRAGVLLDRDGVLNVRPPKHRYVESVDAFEWLPGARAALGVLCRAGYPLAVVSNQRGLARGLVTWPTLSAVEARIQADLAPFGAQVAGFYYCPHERDEGCSCRKPRPGLLLEAAGELQLDLGLSTMIGDSEDDVKAGRAAGCYTILVGFTRSATAPDLVAPDLASAARAILERSGASAPSELRDERPGLLD
jgi:D-glycero-D-manno-heptose 1,7-bisphosphate phosphatase